MMGNAAIWLSFSLCQNYFPWLLLSKLAVIFSFHLHWSNKTQVKFLFCLQEKNFVPSLFILPYLKKKKKDSMSDRIHVTISDRTTVIYTKSESSLLSPINYEFWSSTIRREYNKIPSIVINKTQDFLPTFLLQL